MSKTTTIENLIENLSEQEIESVGSSGQIKLTKSETGKYDIYEFYNTTTEAEDAAEVWEQEE